MPLFALRSCQIGCWTGKTHGGHTVDESWLENDGLVNTISAKAPLFAPQSPLNRADIPPGVWNIIPTFDGDHMALQGSLMRRRDIRAFYLDLLGMVAGLSGRLAGAQPQSP